MVRSISVTTIRAMVDFSTLNILLGISNALALTFGPAKLMATITIMVNMNDKPIQIRNGIS
jgi:hypothetical protein